MRPTTPASLGTVSGASLYLVHHNSSNVHVSSSLTRPTNERQPMELTTNALRILALAVNLLTLALMGYGIFKYGWNPMYLVSISLIAISLTFMSVGFFA